MLGESPQVRQAKGSLLYICGLVGNADVDRCNALVADGWSVTSIEMPLADESYRWDKDLARDFKSLPPAEPFGSFRATTTLMRQVLGTRADACIFYGYQKPAFFLAALLCRLLGRRLLSMNDSKLDDYPRSSRIDLFKGLMLLPYHGFLAASGRAAEYLRYLGCKRVEVYYCAIDQRRFAPLPLDSTAFADRHFICVSRLMEKKNLPGLLDAYRRYTELTDTPRPLLLVGYGPMQAELEARIAADPVLAKGVRFMGYSDSKQVRLLLDGSLALMLVSHSEEFGIVITEALSSARPVIASAQCGASDLVHSWVNGFVVEHDNLEGIAQAMSLMGKDEMLWKTLAANAPESAKPADATRFAALVRTMIGRGDTAA